MIRKLELKIVENLVEHSFFIVLPVELTVPKSKLSDLFIHYSRFGLSYGFFSSKLLRDNIGEEISKGDNVRISVGIHILPTDDTISPGKIITTKKIINCLREGEPSTEVARIDDFGIALNKLKYSRTFSIDNSDLVLSWFYEKNKDIIDALNIIEANINSSRNGIFDASGYQHLIRDYRTLDRIDEIIKGVYNINVVMEVWNR